MIKVLQFVPGYSFGGIESVFSNLYKNIDSDKLVIDLMVEDIADMNIIKNLKQQGCVVHILPRLTYKNIASYISSINKILKNNDYDIIHSFNITRTPILFYIAKKNRIKNRIFHARTNKTDGNILKKLFFRMNINFAILNSTTLIANSKEAGKFFFNNSDYMILNNGLNLKSFFYNEEKRFKIREKLNIKDDFVIGHVGRFTEAKNHIFLINIFNEYLKKNNKSKLLLVGDGPLLTDVNSEINRLQLETKVVFVGAVKNTDEYYQAMDIFLFPSLYEGFGNVVLESQAAGLRTIVSDRLPKTVKVTDLVTFHSLSLGSVDWAELINDIKLENRVKHQKNLLDSGYDISDVVKDYEILYTDLYEK